MLEFGQADKIFKDGLLQERIAYKENDTIKENLEINPEETKDWIHPLEEKETHVKIHSRLIFSAEYVRLEENQQMAINAHAMETVQRLQKEQEAAQLKELELMERAKLIARKPVDEGTR